jgi:hypothetical protein
MGKARAAYHDRWGEHCHPCGGRCYLTDRTARRRATDMFWFNLERMGQCRMVAYDGLVTGNDFMWSHYKREAWRYLSQAREGGSEATPARKGGV